jgi:hypothetical protein
VLDGHARDAALADEGTELLGRVSQDISKDNGHETSMNRTWP